MSDEEKIIENSLIENKTISTGQLPKDLWEVITAFSNADGGTINLGVLPDGTIQGVDPKFHDDLQKELQSLCKTGFNHALYPQIVVTPQNVIKVYIPPVPASFRPIYSQSRGLAGCRVRIGSTNERVDDEWIRRFAIASQGGAEQTTFKVGYKDYLDLKSIDDYLEVIKAKRGDVYKSFNHEEILKKLRVLNDDGDLTMFGLLAFSNAFGLQELTATTTNIAVTQYAGTDKVNPADILEVSIDDKEFNGSVVTQFKEALKFILSKLPVRSRIGDEGRRVSYLAIPEVAVRETLANAVVHRDYTTFRSRIQVDIYADRVEFKNPGRSLVPIEKLETSHPQSRNPLLMSFLKDLDITEHRGRGIRTIRNSLRQAHLAEPFFANEHDWFTAIIYSSAFITEDDQAWLEKFVQYKLTEAQLNALVHAKHNPQGMTNQDFRKINVMGSVGDDVKAKKSLVKLVKMGLMTKTGVKKYTKYRLSPTRI